MLSSTDQATYIYLCHCIDGWFTEECWSLFDLPCDTKLWLMRCLSRVRLQSSYCLHWWFIKWLAVTVCYLHLIILHIFLLIQNIINNYIDYKQTFGQIDDLMIHEGFAESSNYLHAAKLQFLVSCFSTVTIQYHHWWMIHSRRSC